MIVFPVLFNVFTSLLFGGQTFFQKPDPCEEARTGAVAATLFAKDSLYKVALTNIKNAFRLDMKEHCVAFGKDTTDNIIASVISNGKPLLHLLKSIHVSRRLLMADRLVSLLPS